MSDDKRVQQLQKELLEVQKRYKNIEQDRKAYNEETQANFRKQRNIIEKLQKENQQLKEELVLSNNITAKNVKQVAQMQSTMEEIEQIKKQIEAEAAMANEMDSHLAQIQQTIINEKKKLGGVNATNENYNQVQKQIGILENRLDKANQKFNEAIAYNKRLRQVIENLRKERCIFDTIYKKLEKELHEKRKNMADIISKANKAYEDRDKAQDDLSKLIQTAETDQKSYAEKLTEINKLVEKAKPLEAHLKSKENENDDGVKENENIDDEFNRKERNGWMNEGGKYQMQNIPKKLQYYEEAFSKIQAATSITDIDKLIETFTEAEKNNFDSYKFVNYLNAEIESLELQIEEMKNEMKLHDKKEKCPEELQKQDKIKELDKVIDVLRFKTTKVEERNKKIKERFDLLKVNIESIYKNIDCNEIAPYELLSSPGVTFANVLLHLKVIEKRKLDMILALSELSRNKEKNGEQIQTTPGLNLQQLTSVVITDEFARPNPNELFTKVEQVKCDISSEDLLASNNIGEFRKMIEAKLKASPSPVAATKVEEI